MTTAGRPLLAVADAVHRYPNGAGVGGVSLSVRAGQVHAIVGLNGAGKSSLMRLVLSMIDLQSGDIRVLGVPVRDAGAAEWARVGHAVEGAESYPDLTVQQNLLLAARLQGLERGRAHVAVREVMEELDIAGLASRRARALSSGNRQRVRVAAALLHDPQLVILDEPTAFLDPAGVLLLRGAIRARAERGVGFLISSHHLDEIARTGDTVTVLNAGRVIGTIDPHGFDIERAFFALVRADLGEPG
ncbi:ABC transporter ATP-binding protein [Pseudactinotalea suaedae]|uniref:ABC transporter ATP-binding protein n=1 Tax=Pseudactinotalea suaedae TaxID=1524924 RepID=UPI0012E2A093|nr:ABC transporter ATP-binding protein [Pseudactinotalea suaedae]